MTTPTLQTLAAKAAERLDSHLRLAGYGITAPMRETFIEVILAALEQVQSAASPELSTKAADVSTRIGRCLLAMAPHQKDRPTGRLLQEAQEVLAGVKDAAAEGATAQAGETPLTDALYESMKHLCCTIGEEQGYGYRKALDFARQLERELNEAKANLAIASANSRRNGEAAEKFLGQLLHAPAPAALPEVREAITKAMKEHCEQVPGYSQNSLSIIGANKLLVRLLSALQPHLASAREDSELIDWQEKNEVSVDFDPGFPAVGHGSGDGPEPGQPSSWGAYIKHTGKGLAMDTSLRGAIRAARAKEQP